MRLELWCEDVGERDGRKGRPVTGQGPRASMTSLGMLVSSERKEYIRKRRQGKQKGDGQEEADEQEEASL